MYGGTATHCTLTANRAIIGGGTYSTTLDHSIVWYNTALESFSNMAYGTATDSCSPELEHGSNGNITNNPQLVSASHIKLSSPCAGSGTIPRDTPRHRWGSLALQSSNGLRRTHAPLFRL